MVTRTISVNKKIDVDIDVEVDLGDFDAQDILQEATARGLIGVSADGLGAQREAMLRALWDHDEKHVIELLKTYLCDVLGRAAI